MISWKERELHAHVCFYLLNYAAGNLFQLIITHFENDIFHVILLMTLCFTVFVLILMRYI